MSPKSSTPTIAITGAGGLVGRALIDHCVARGWHVRALVRDPSAQPARPHVNYRAYDMTNTPDEALLSGADYLVHAAYIKDDAQHPDAYQQNVSAAKQLLALARQSGIKHTVFLSTMSAHGDATSTYAKQKLAIEKLFSEPTDTVLRCGLIVGNGGLIKNIVGFMRRMHVAPYIDQGGQPLQVIAVYDLVKIIEITLTSQVGGKFYIAHPDIYSYREFYRMLIDELQLRAVTVPLPSGLLLTAIRTINALHLPLQVTKDNLQGLKHLRAFETLPDLQKLGIEVDDLYHILHNPELRKVL